MYKCRHCGEVFDEPRVYQEFHGFNDHPETWSCCPYCGGDYEELLEEELNEEVEECWP